MRKHDFIKFLEYKIEELAQEAKDNCYSPKTLIRCGIKMEELDCLLDDISINPVFTDQFFAGTTDKDIDEILQEINDYVNSCNDDMSWTHNNFEFISKIGAARMWRNENA